MTNTVFKPMHAGVFFGLLLTVSAAIAQPSLPPASMVINEPTRLGAEEQKNAAPGQTLPEGNAVSVKGETKNFSVGHTTPCDTDAIACIEIISQAALDQADIPFTFEQPFKMGDWKYREKGLLAKDNLNNVVPLQYGQVSSNVDGSANIALLSGRIENLKPLERRVINIFLQK